MAAPDTKVTYVRSYKEPRPSGRVEYKVTVRRQLDDGTMQIVYEMITLEPFTLEVTSGGA